MKSLESIDRGLWQQQIRIPRAELALLTRQISVMLEAGLGLRQALDVLTTSATDEGAEVVLHHILIRVEAGSTLSSAMANFPLVFGQVYLAMVEVGEETGQLVRTLSNLADWLEREESLIRQVRGALTYPLIVLGAAALLAVGFFVVIFPSFSETLKGLKNLPLLTLVLMKISDGLRSPILWLLGLVLTVGVVYFANQSMKVPKNRLAYWRLMSTLPVLSPLLRDYGASRFASAMAILLQTGVDILKSFHLASLASGSPMVIAQMEEGIRKLSLGGDLADFMRDHPNLYPAMMSGLVMVGQESASLPDIFLKLQQALNEETEHRLAILTSMLEPLLMAFVSVLVGLLVVGVALPMYGLVNSVM